MWSKIISFIPSSPRLLLDFLSFKFTTFAPKWVLCASAHQCLLVKPGYFLHCIALDDNRKVHSMKYVFRLIRWPLGQIIIFIDWVTRPAIPDIPPQRQAELDAATSNFKLYQFKQCPFCVKTRRTIRRLGLNIETRDARNDPQWNSELINQGGKYKVPCLRIAKDDGSIEWIYESDNIIGFLDQRFGGIANP